jgi:hypothetical protein
MRAVLCLLLCSSTRGIFPICSDAPTDAPVIKKQKPNSFKRRVVLMPISFVHLLFKLPENSSLDSLASC